MNTLLSKLPGFRDFFFIMAAMCAVVAIAGIEPILVPDTGSYLEGHFFREPGYPFVLQTAMAIAGSSYATVVVILQQLAGVLAAYFLCSFFRERFELPYWLFSLIMVIALSPYFSVHTGKIGNTIQSEGLTYPLFLLAFALSVFEHCGCEHQGLCRLYLRTHLITSEPFAISNFHPGQPVLPRLFCLCCRKKKTSNRLACSVRVRAPDFQYDY